MISVIHLFLFTTTVVASVTGSISFDTAIIPKEIDNIVLNPTNVITINGEITDDLASQFVYELNQSPSKENMYVYLDTNGGSVSAGNRIVDEIQKYQLDCVAQKAISMGFVILQSCKTRYITRYAILMQHQMSYGIMNEKEKVENYVEFISQIAVQLERMQSDKIGITSKKLKENTYNDWWLFGENGVRDKCADQIANVMCSLDLTNTNYTVESAGYKYTYSKCPLVTNYIDKEKISKKKSLDDYIYM